jgi:hypothetical protein
MLQREELLKIHQETCDASRKLMESKNQDYGANSDALRNFHWFGAFGIIVRLSDKLARLRTFIEKSQLVTEKDGKVAANIMAVTTESWEDTIQDGINYLILLKAYIKTHGIQK